MAQLPFMIKVEPFSLLSQHFGEVFTPDDNIINLVYEPLPDAGIHYTSIKNDKDKFQVNIDVQHFKPEEISVTATSIYIVVEGNHDEKRDEQGYISRQFTRRYVLPKYCNPEDVESRLSSDGVLTVTAPCKWGHPILGKRQVTITETGPVRMEIKYSRKFLTDML